MFLCNDQYLDKYYLESKITGFLKNRKNSCYSKVIKFMSNFSNNRLNKAALRFWSKKKDFHQKRRKKRILFLLAEKP